MLHQLDANNYAGIRLPRLQNMRASAWTDLVQRRGIGGSAWYAVKLCRYAFFQEDGSMIEVDGSIHIAEASPASNALPSVLGRDLLRFFTFSVTPSRDEVLLEYLR
jgi:hypothetical protein